MVDLHAELPESKFENLKLDQLRVKHKPSLGDKGVHGRQNPQASGCNLYPFLFEIEGISISVPNPVTWCVMKLISTRDRRLKSESLEQDEEYREYQRQQSIKHAKDVTRVVAMITREERDHASNIIAKIRDRDSFADAVKVCDELFHGEDGWGVQVAAGKWRSEDLEMIRSILRDWFRQS